MEFKSIALTKCMYMPYDVVYCDLGYTTLCQNVIHEKRAVHTKTMKS